MGNVSTTAAEMQPVTDLPLEKVNECAKYYFDNDMDFGLNSAGCVDLLTKGAGLSKETAEAAFSRFADPENPAALFSSLDFLGAAVVVCKGDDEAKKKAIFDLFDFSKEGKIGFDEVVIAIQGTLRGIMKLTGAAKVDDALVDAVEAKVKGLDGVTEDAEFDCAAMHDAVGKLCGGAAVSCASLLTGVGIEHTLPATEGAAPAAEEEAAAEAPAEEAAAEEAAAPAEEAAAEDGGGEEGAAADAEEGGEEAGGEEEAAADAEGGAAEEAAADEGGEDAAEAPAEEEAAEEGGGEEEEAAADGEAAAEAPAEEAAAEEAAAPAEEAAAEEGGGEEEAAAEEEAPAAEEEAAAAEE